MDYRFPYCPRGETLNIEFVAERGREIDTSSHFGVMQSRESERPTSLAFQDTMGNKDIKIKLKKGSIR